MPKARKTRKEKIIADLNRKLQLQGTKEVFLSPLPERGQKIASAAFETIVIAKHAYPYLVHDLRKTALFTGGILAAELSLFYLLKSHIFNIPNLIY